MTVWVDDMRAKVGRMVMCHMVATTEDELHRMATAIGVARRWYQGNHYDVCLQSRSKAVEAGAVQVSSREMALMTVLRRRDPHAFLVTPEEGRAWLRSRREK